MASQRSNKSQSLGIDTTPSDTSKAKKSPSTTRPDLGDRHQSAPSVPRHKPNNSKSSLNRNSKNSTHSDSALKGGSNASADHESRSSRSSKRSSNQEDIRVLNFAVIGNEGVGKTSFIRNALDLHKHKTISPISTSKVSLCGKLYRVQLIEVPLKKIGCSDEGNIIWPKQINNVTFPRIDGSFCLFDVTEKRSVLGLHPVLSALSELKTPNSIVSCKVDVTDVDQEPALAFSERAQKTFEGLMGGEATIESSESAKRCLLRVLKVVLIESDPDCFTMTDKVTEPIKASPDTKLSSRSPSQSQSRSPGRSKRNSSRSISKDYQDLISSPTKRNSDQLPKVPTAEAISLKLDTQNLIQSRRHDNDPQTPVSTTEPTNNQVLTPANRRQFMGPETPESYANHTAMRPGTASTYDSRIQQTFLNMDDDSIHSATSENGTSQVETLGQLSLQDTKSDPGVPFSDLVDRLLSFPITRSDEKFIPSFLCLYRCFGTPNQLLTEIADRFVQVEISEKLVPFTKVAEQLRYLSILSLWTEEYPGDFASANVRDVMMTFVKSIEKSKHFGPAAKEINNNLLVYFNDEDEDWAYNDKPNNRIRSVTSAHKGKSEESSTRIRSTGLQHVNKDNDDSEDETDKTQSSPRNSGAPSSASSIQKSGHVTTKSATNQATLERARENARRLRCVPHVPVGKVQWHMFMDSPIDEIAREIVRIDWVTYSAIRPRDFVRQAILTGTQKIRSTQFDAIVAMSQHFNHLTFFVSGMILLRDKPKHRAKILEKFMNLAWKVRQQNDYQSLGAIVAALKGEEILRLAQTHELIPQDTLKQFWRLKILMDHQRSHSAYRMAWENSFNERIPFLPRVQEDLTKAAAGNPTFIGQNVKWSKFEVMGETIIGLQKSRETAYMFPERTQKSQELVRLLLETKVLDGPEDSDDPRNELYERSKQIEPQTAIEGKKKFDWLRR